MRKAVTAAVSAIVIATTLGATPATAGSLGRFEVTGVDEDDMLKMRAGPGTGFIVLLGLPNGHVSWAYLRKLR